MKKIMLMLCLSLLVMPVFVATAQQDKMTSRHERMKQCHADAKAKNLQGAEREKFMSDCMRAKK